MRGSRFTRWTAGVVVGLLSLADAEASLEKPDGSPPLIMPNTLLVEAGERTAAAPTTASPGSNGRTIAHAKESPRTCSAAAIRVPHQGTRIVTARHCADHRVLEVLDEKYHVTPFRQVDADGEVDLSVLEVSGKIPWSGLEMSSAANVAIGDRLCAWRMRRGLSGIVRERICARLVRRDDRPGADPLLVTSHPYPAGTSGSALVDREGRVVGIVVASTGYAGLAEPIDGILHLPPPPRLLADTAVPAAR
ncbi:MAG TPA: serine protease [Polyangiaceae bacterium]